MGTTSQDRHPPTKASAMHYRIASATQRQKRQPSGRRRRSSNRPPNKVDLPICFESEGDARTAEDPTDSMRRFDFEFVFFLGWWVPDRDQQFVAGDRWRWGSGRG